MEHIRQYDWCSSEPDVYFLKEYDLDRCVTEKILRNKFYDPNVSSDSENETTTKIDWDEVFKKKDNDRDINHRIFVPGLRAVPPYPKLSSLTIQQHHQCLKVLCHENPHILPGQFMLRPTKNDHRAFEQLKEIYGKEQKEYIEWAKTLWVNGQCIRALRPKPAIELIYEAEFKVKALEMQSFPKVYHMAAQISLETRNGNCEIVHQKDLIKVNVNDLPQISYPEEITKRFNIIRPSTTPEPCIKHPCRFILPGENSVTILPLTEVHRELAQFGTEHGAQYVVSESALRCFVETDRHWALPLSVCQTIGPDGEEVPVAVVGSEARVARGEARARSVAAYAHLLLYAFVAPSERCKMMDQMDDGRGEETDDMNKVNNFMDNMDVTSDEEENELYIDTGDMQLDTDSNQPDQEDTVKTTENCEKDKKPINVPKDRDTRFDDASDIGIYTCTCKGTIFEKPPPRSFKKWQVRNKTTNEKHDVIIHNSHKARGTAGEVILEPILEYQIELGGSVQSQNKIRSLALALELRRNASLLNVRIDAPTGDVVVVEHVHKEEFVQRHGDAMPTIADTVHAALEQLRGLLPGNYILQHEPSHGANALLYATRPSGGPQLVVRGASGGQGGLGGQPPADADEARGVRVPPSLAPALLPYHKSRRILPCAFTPYDQQVAKETKKPVTRQKPPPQAIKWPKRKRKRRNNANN